MLTHENSKIGSHGGKNLDHFSRKVHLPASQYSKIFWLEAQRLPPEEQSRYHVYGIFHYGDQINKTRLEMALQMLVNTNYNLRTNFVSFNQTLQQLIHQDKTVQLTSYSAKNDLAFEKKLQQLAQEPFNLAHDCLFRFALIFHEEKKRTTFVAIFHHIILDGTQFDALMQQIETYYHKPIELGFRDTQALEHLEAYLNQEETLPKKNNPLFWLDKLSTYPRHIPFPARSNTAPNNFQEIRQLYKLQPRLYEQLKTFSIDTGHSIFHILKATWALLISIYSGQEKLVISFPVNMRGKQPTQLKGAFVNTPFYCFERSGTFLKHLDEEKSNIEARQHWSVPRAELALALKESDFSVYFSQSDLFTSGPILEGNPEPAPHRFVGGIGGAKLCFFYQEKRVGVAYGLAGLAEWVDEPFLEQMHQHFEVLLKKLLAAPNTPLKKLSCLSSEEHHKIAYLWNQSAPIPLSNKTLHELFEEQVEKAPDHLAIESEDIKLTYRELNQKANQLAHYLHEKHNPQPDDVIAVCLQPSELLIITLLAILKVGAAYMPISPRHLGHYVSATIKNAQAKVLVIQNSDQNKFRGEAKLVVIDSEETRSLLNKFPVGNFVGGLATGGSLAYTIYTSGTTGTPKGVMVEHRNAVSLLKQPEYLPITHEHTVIQLADISFDAASFEIYVALLNGACLCIPKDPLRLLTHPQVFKDYLIQHKINVLWLTKTIFDFLYLSLENIFSSIKYLFVGGEALNYPLVKALSESQNKPEHFFNGYGPTECTTFSTIYPITKENIAHRQIASIPIGKPISGRATYILDDNQNLLPPGVIGSLYIGGSGLARGYFNDPAFTSKKFIPHPFQKNERLYKTGDLARYLSDGNIEYIGREDFQIKIRGYRIELSAIEAKLLEHESMKQAVVIVSQHPILENECLVGYYVADHLLNHEAILEDLRAHLPEYMLPSTLVHLDQLPLAVNGKLDKKALPKPQWTDTHHYIAPQNEIEKEICRLYAEVFSLPQDGIGRTANFFRLGGNSILAIQVAHRLSQRFGTPLLVAEIFRAKTIVQLAEAIQSIDKKNVIIPRAEGLSHYPLSFAQERLWFIEQYEEGTAAYHIPQVMKLAKNISLEALNQALAAIVQRHEVLRTLFIQDDQGQQIQSVQETPIKIHTQTCQSLEAYEKKLKEEIHRPFNLSSEYPIRISLYKFSNDDYLLVNMHHIVSDGWSIDIFQKELIAYYEHYHFNKRLSLPNLPIQYKDFGVWQRSSLVGEALQKELKYWKSRLENSKTLQLLTDKPRPPQLSYAGKTLAFSIEHELSKKLRAFSKLHRCSLYTVLLAGFYVLLNKYTGQEDILIGTPMTNRPHRATQDLIGFFVNMLVQREILKLDKSIEHLIAEIHQHIAEAQQYQNLPFEKLIEALNLPRDPSRHPLFQVTFAVQNFGKGNESFRQYFQLLETNHLLTACDLGFLIEDAKPTLHGTILYSDHLFERSTVHAFIQHYLNILQQIVDEPQKNLKSYVLCDYQEYCQIMNSGEFQESVASNKALHQIFEEQVKQNPEAIAILSENGSLTYKALNSKVNQLAHYLKKRHGEFETPIGVFMERSPEMIVAIFAILKLGRACVPLFDTEPLERQLNILNDTKLSIILVDKPSQNQASTYPSSLEFLNVSQDFSGPVENLGLSVDPEKAAFIVYTSGSTGVPKGVIIPHRVFSRCEFFAKEVFCFFQNDKFLFKSIRAPEEFLFPLFRGASLVVAPPGSEKDPVQLIQTLIKHKVSVANFTPSFLYALLDYVDIKNPLPLKHVFCAGEILSPELQSRFFGRLSAYLYNFYGLAEAPYTAYARYGQAQKMVLIGKPVDAKVYVLDSARQILPPGVVGELYIGGPGLACGYLNHPELTTERFIPNPFETGTLLYKTGDLVRYFSDGNIEYIGRNDFQIKVRGFRVELQEIEHRLLQFPEIKQAAVVLKKGPGPSLHPSLVAYYVADLPLEASELLQNLSAYLPEYMLPTNLVQIKKFPLNANGKLDRKALPEPKWSDVDDYIAPQNEIETEICHLYAEFFTKEKKTIGRAANFFRLGGNSILAIQLAYRLSQRFEVHLSVAEIFRAKTIAQLANTIQNIGKKNIIISRAEGLNNHPLSFAQERLWFIEQYEEGLSAYHLPQLLKLRNHISIDAIIQALKAIVKRHEVLRTLFFQDSSGHTLQNVHDIPLNITRRPCKTPEAYEEQLYKDVNRPFDLRKEYPIRICLYKLHQTHYLLINIHHIASDGYSMELFQKELLAYYEHYHFNKPLSLPHLPIQYKDFSVWQRDYLSKEVLEKQLAYWRSLLENHQALCLPTDKPRPANFSYAGAHFTFSLTLELSTKLKRFAQTHGYTLYTVLIAGFYVFLHQYTGQEDILIGSPITNRQHDALKNLLGFFVNVFAQRERIDRAQPITYLLDQIHQHLIEAQEHQEIPFEKLVQALNVTRKGSHHPLFQVLFSVQNFGKEEGDFSKYYEAVDITKFHPVTRFDLELAIDDSQSAFEGMITYATDLFHESTIQRWVEHYKNILSELSNDSGKALKDYKILSPQEYQKLIFDWNRTKQTFPEEKTLHQLFEMQVEQTPHATALVYQGVKLGYKNLNEKANQLAHYLRNTYKLAPDDLVALCLRRSEKMLISILGVLKAGAAYLPIDPDAPSARVQHMLQESHAKVLLTEKTGTFGFLHESPTLFLEDQEIQQKISKQLLSNPPSIGHSRHLAYAMYTSGTSGKPKAVMIEHRSVINTLHSLKKIYNLHPTEKSVAFTQYTFDVSLSEFFIPLFSGAELHLLSDEVRKDPAHISAYIQSEGIHWLYLPPALLSLLPQIPYRNLRGIIYAGEPCDSKIGSYWSKRLKLLNYYGPTETSIYALGKEVIDGDTHLIGRPLPNTSAYVLNQDLTPVPIGVIGELHLGGLGLARGYLNQPELSAERFIPNPFEPGTRLYKTGDLVRYLPDGNLEYIGRNDFQIKLRGFRIELGEIEHHLLQYPGIKQAIVTAHQPGDPENKYLVGYYLADHELDHENILEALAENLPSHMIPSTLMYLAQFPLTGNGKLDRKALPIPEWKTPDAYVAPQNEIELAISYLYAEIFSLPQKKIGSNANFFRLGGNSILAIQVVHQLSKRFNIHLPIAEIFRAKNIEQLAKCIRAIETKNIIIPRTEGLNRYPLSFAQERLWFIEQYEEGTAAYHMPRLVRLKEDLCLPNLIKALKAIVDRHEVLRTLFTQDNVGRENQSVQDATLKIYRRTCQTLETYEKQLKEDVNRPFNLREEYPIRICLYKIEKKCYLLVNMHHIASDGWSIDIFQKELVAYYEYYHFNKPLSLPKLPIQYKDFSVWQRTYLVGDLFEKQLKYWQARLKNYQPLSLPTDKPRPAKLSYAGKTFFFYLTLELSSQLRTFAQMYGFSLYVVLLSAFYLLLFRYSGQSDLILGTPTANRHYESIKDLIGSFVNVIAQREQLDTEENILHLMFQVNQHLTEAQEHQDLPFEKLIRELKITRDVRFHPLFQVMFSVQSFGQKEEKYADYFESIDITEIHPITRFDLAYFISTTQPNFKGLVSYATELFHEESMRSLLSDYISILTQMVNNPHRHLNTYQTLTQAPSIKFSQPEINLPTPFQILPRDALEEKLSRIFEKLLALPPSTISIHDDFFQLGGTSLLAMQLSFQLSKLTKKTFPIIEVFRNSTIEKLAGLLKAAQKEGGGFLESSMTIDKEYGSGFLVPLRELGRGHPLFVISGGQGEGFPGFLSLAMKLKTDCPIYGVRSKILDAHWTVPKTLREQAEAVFQSIQKIQPKGPYYFFCACIGSALGVQLQQLAEEQGNPHGAVFLVNSHPLFRQKFSSSPMKPLAKVKKYYDRLRRFFRVSEKSLLEKIKHLFKRIYLEVHLNIPKKADAYYHLLHSGDPVTLHSDLHLLLSSDENAPEDLLKKWQTFFKKNTCLYKLEGDHRTIYIEEIEKIAKIIDHGLSSTQLKFSAADKTHEEKVE